MDRKLRYGLIGVGNNAVKKHLTNYAMLSNVELVAISDINMEHAEKVAERFAISKVYKNYQDMIKEENLDIVSVTTPNSLHADITIYALQHGVNVHCEKPLAINALEAQRIVDAKNTSGKLVMIGLNNRFTNAAIYLKKLMDTGYFGHIYKINTGWVRRSGIPGRGTWFTNKSIAGGGVLIDLGAHYLDLALYLLGLPEPKYITGATYQNFTHTTARNRNGYAGDPNGIFNVEDSATGFLGLENGSTIHFEFSWASNIEEERTFVEVLGTKGGASIVNGKLKIQSELLDTCIDVIPVLNDNIKLLSEFEHFTNAILNNGNLLAPAEHGVYLMDIIDHFYRAADIQEPVFFDKTIVLN
ncbi:Gfo/Idh/MocA family protein (plasmid) [Niallia taxi]|uniref:Gfo/Idh/MocA family oxidoreductase n=1 Tax=Niallia taxi TaxID=2499688 RepID=A0A437K996_9BACI|nr:Gfo/Idh/MocA family oxidoreductase [Niallia taxi]MCM3213144.1 Gfo/Idh/MocA family oxidoreductase [Niallia taxi]MED4036487.1 Gfo/Idh/MocA family oxidoreductase [Niallia taxi]RVT60863.1 Gfo/Idh/MocA family oxidoreductase [Niallia taxi]